MCQSGQINIERNIPEICHIFYTIAGFQQQSRLPKYYSKILFNFRSTFLSDWPVAKFGYIPLVDDGTCGYIKKLKAKNKKNSGRESPGAVTCAGILILFCRLQICWWLSKWLSFGSPTTGFIRLARFCVYVGQSLNAYLVLPSFLPLEKQKGSWKSTLLCQLLMCNALYMGILTLLVQ